MVVKIESRSDLGRPGSDSHEIVPFDVRRLLPADIFELIELCREHAAYEGATYEEVGQADRLLDALFDPVPRLYGWLALRHDVPCGFMTATIDFATWTARPFLHMDCLYLRGHARGNGLGSALIAALREFSIQRGCELIQWQTPPTNDLGIRFYTKIGATHKPKLRYFLTP